MSFRKALWVVRDRIVTAEAIQRLVADASARAIGDLVVQVRGRGDAYYASSLEPRPEAVAPDLDPLAVLVNAAAARDLRIHAWANVYFVWSHPEKRPPRDDRHLVHAHPDWLLRPDGVNTLDPAGGSDFEGIYTDPADTAAREHTIAVFEDIVARYPVAGLHYDYVRYPQVTYASSANDHRHVTALVRESAERLRRLRPGVVISAAVFPDPEFARDRVLQRWPEWAGQGLVDLLCPMAYRRDSTLVARLLAAARAAAPHTEMWGGLMAYADAPHLVAEQVGVARDAGCDGVVLFAYDPDRYDLLDVFAAA